MAVPCTLISEHSVAVATFSLFLTTFASGEEEELKTCSVSSTSELWMSAGPGVTGVARVQLPAEGQHQPHQLWRWREEKAPVLRAPA